ncbi:MAG TPA: hypothetical protein VJT13_00335 [Xanthobacteraceae bacterium]|nr:hypothetical protein [Xanthobacteraceae bacterium]
MRHRLKLRDAKSRAVVFGLLPCALGVGAARVMHWTDTVWLTTAGSFWPIALSGVSVAILVKLMFSPFEDRTVGWAAWLTLVWTWFHVPLWATAREVPYDAAIVGRDGRVHVVREEARDPKLKVWFLTDQPGTRIVHNVAGQVIASALELEYRYAESYIATRRDNEDLAEPLRRAASAILQKQAALPRSSKIELIEKRAVQDRVLDSICRATVGDRAACPLKIRLSPQAEATALGATWSKSFSEKEAIEEKHLPTLLKLLTQPDSPLLHRDEVFALLLEIAEDVVPLSQVAQQSHLLDDGQFDTLIRRILASPGCGNEAVAIISKAIRLTPEQRLALRAKALGEASIATLLAQAVSLRFSDPDIAQLAARMRSDFMADPGVAVRALEVFGERLPTDIQRDAVTEIVKAKTSYALAALHHVNFSTALRLDLLKKVLSDARHDDFSGLSKEKLLGMLTPAEMRALIAMAVKRSETSGQWLDFAHKSLPIGEMTPDEQKSLLTELLFKSPKAALEFVSENRRHLEPADVDEVTRDYTRTITTDMCLHLSHRNSNRKTEYFSEAQLQIFRDCAGSK